jgi:hypothetical protein
MNRGLRGVAIALAFLVAFMEAIAQAEVLPVSRRMMGFAMLKLAYAYRTIGLILGRNCNLCLRCKVGQENFNFRYIYLFRMLFVIEIIKVIKSVWTGLFSAAEIMLKL